MSPKHLESSRDSIESCTLDLLSWLPFQCAATSKTLDFSHPPKPFFSTSIDMFHSTTPKRPCFYHRSTSISIDSLRLSRLKLADNDDCCSGGKPSVSDYNRGRFRLVARKRRRRNSRSVSSRSSDRSGTRRCGSNVAHGSCSDFPFAIGTDSSGELFREANWGFDFSEARNSQRDSDSSGEKERCGFGFVIKIEAMDNESGYGSDTGYRGDAEFGYGDEFDEEEEDLKSKPLFWGNIDSRMEISGEMRFSDSKTQFRFSRRRHSSQVQI